MHVYINIIDFFKKENWYSVEREMHVPFLKCLSVISVLLKIKGMHRSIEYPTLIIQLI